jgi:hypothetical protein
MKARAVVEYGIRVMLTCAASVVAVDSWQQHQVLITLGALLFAAILGGGCVADWKR